MTSLKARMCKNFSMFRQGAMVGMWESSLKHFGVGSRPGTLRNGLNMKKEL